jgi:pteridine reductase
MELTGRVALVTGGGKRVGRAIVERLAQAGCQVAIHYNRSESDAEEAVATCRSLGVAADAFGADLGDRDAVAALVPSVVARLGRLDILINNASIFETMPIEDFTLAEWDRTLQINLTAPMMLIDAAREELTRRGGRIVNLCDVSTSRPWPDHVAYMVSKGALDTLTRVAARALAPRVNVVGIAPGAVVWPPDYDEALRQKLTAKIPLQRVGSAADIAAAVHFLLREGDYLTGVILPVDGGRQIV